MTLKYLNVRERHRRHILIGFIYMGTEKTTAKEVLETNAYVGQL